MSEHSWPSLGVGPPPFRKYYTIGVVGLSFCYTISTRCKHQHAQRIIIPPLTLSIFEFVGNSNKMWNIWCRLGLVLFGLLILSVDNASAADPDPLQDFCVADLKNYVKVNGFVCKNPETVSAEDFFYRGLAEPGDTNNPAGSKVTPVNVEQIAGLNTLGISLVRIDYAPAGINAPHTHPRATEILVVVEGKLFVGFVTTNNNTFFSMTLEKGDVFVFPRGLVHFQQNVGYGNAIAIAALSSQLPGTQTIANALFGAKPPLPDPVLSKAFRIDQKLVDYIQAKFQ